MRMGRMTMTAIIRSLRQVRARFARNERGVTSIEFAMVATPFIGITFAIVETSLILLSGQALDSAVQDSTRRILTGQTQVAGLTQTQFKTEICARMTTLVNCTGGLHIDARSYTASAPAPQMPITSGNFDVSGFIFKPGGPSCLVVFRAALEYPVYVSLLGTNLQTLNNGKRVVLSTVSFRNEPYTMAAPPPCQSTP
jgi:Flp pilus assembly protein TadG